jgi:hypothetical protein
MSIALGNKAEGAAFFDRENERQDLWRYLEGDHVVLSGPRRLGKSSLLQRLADEAAGQGLLARLVDVGGVDTPAGFIDALDRAFPDQTIAGHLRGAGDAVDRLMSRLRKVDMKLPGGLGGGIELQAPPDAAWSQSARHLQERLSQAPVLLLVDEVSVFLEKVLARDQPDTVRLLAWLRGWRQQSGLACRFLFSGSIGLNALLAVRSRFTHWYQRLERDLSPTDLTFTLRILGSVATADQGLTRRQVLARLGKLEPDPDRRAARLDQAMLGLEEDGYLDASGEHIQFPSFILRDYWRRNHGR